MKILDEITIQTKCSDCTLRDSEFFCNFSPATFQSFQNIKITNTYPKGAHLFVEGHPIEGVFMICQGRVKLTTHSQSGKSFILRIAVPGEILGLSSVIADSVSETTAEVIEACQINFVLKSEFRRFLEQNTDAGMNALRQLSRQYQQACTQIRSFALSSCVADKLATLLLDWSRNQPNSNGSARITHHFSHEEIAEMIGTSRETVTRVLKDFRLRKLIAINGTELYIPDTHQLEATIGNGR
jgi:CRP/FNR family cyclic AMP-dependent transcriptional regulator